MSQVRIERISCKPEVCGGKPCIDGTRIRVQDIYIWHELQGLSADEIVSRFPQITMADVYAALTYYWDHRDEIQLQMQNDADFIENLKQKYPSALNKNLAGKNVENNPFSP